MDPKETKSKFFVVKTKKDIICGWYTYSETTTETSYTASIASLYYQVIDEAERPILVRKAVTASLIAKCLTSIDCRRGWLGLEATVL